MNERENIMSRIRAALRLTAMKPGLEGTAIHAALPGKTTSTESVQKWLPNSGETPEEQVEHFRIRSEELKTDFRLLASPSETEAVLGMIADTEKWRRIATHKGALTDAAVYWLGLPALHTSGRYDVNELETCDASITACDALVAQTGSVILTSRDAGGRALSVLPPHHVVLARRDQIVRDLSTGLERVQEKYALDYPSMISIVTGPSRTGDIERILVLGAHGPRKLTILCW